MAAVFDNPPPPPPPPPVPGAGGAVPGFGARPPQAGGGGAAGMHGGPGGPGGPGGGRPFGAGGMAPGGAGGPGGPGGPGGLGGLGAGGLPQGRPGANTHRPLDHQLGNATGPVNRSFHGWSFRKDREPGVEASWARARKTPLPYEASELLRIVNRTTTTSPSAPSSSRKSGKGTVSEQYNSLRSPHQRALIDGLLEAVKGEERNPNAEWSLACIEQEVAEYIRKGFGKVREVREMRVVLRRGPRRDVPAAAAPTGDGLPGEIVDLLNGHGQGPHRPSQPLQQQQPMGMAMGMGRGAAPGGGPPFGGAGGGGGAAGPGPGPGLFAAGGAPGGFAGGQGGGVFGRGAAMNPGGGGGPFGGGAGGGAGGGGGGEGGGGPHGMGGGVPNISMVPPPPPPVSPMGPPKGGFGGHGPTGHGPHGGQKAGKISKSPHMMPESDLDDDDMDSLPEPVYSKPPKPAKGKKGVNIPRPPFPPSRSHSRERGGKSPKSREPELHRVPTIINNTIKIPREKKGGHSRKTHNRPKYYPSSSDDDHYTLTPRSSDDETWSTSPSSMSGSSPGRYRQSRSREGYGYRPIRTTREHKKPAPQPRPILREYPRPPVGYPVDAEGYYENGGYDALERRGYDRHEEPWRHHAAHRALPEKDYMAYSSPRRGYHERSRERERARLPPAPEVSTYDAPWRRAAAARRMEEEELVEREQAAQAELGMHMRRERVRNLEAATDEARGRRYGRRGDWW